MAKINQLTKPDQNLRDPKKPMRLLCLGLPRTGTTSLRQALLDLGISDVYHFNSVLNNSSDCEKWCEAFDLKFGKEKGDVPKGLNWNAEQWDQILGHCMAITDNPCISFAPELLKAYPKAKILLNTRDTPEAWVKSFTNTILPIESAFHHPTRNPFKLLHRYLQSSTPFTNLITNISIHSPAPSSKFHEIDPCSLYLSHNQNIRDLMKHQPDRFLEFNVKQGWEPLCEFLGVDIPRDEVTGEVRAFPRLNDTVEFWRLWKRDEKGFYEVSMMKIVMVVGVVGVFGLMGMMGFRNGRGWRGLVARG